MDGEINGNTKDGNFGGVPSENAKAESREAQSREDAQSREVQSRKARSSSARGSRAAWMALAVVAAVLFWGVNALAVRSVLDDPAALHAFLGNLQIFAVAITSAVAASVAWAGGGLGRARGEVPVWVLSVLASLASLGCGLGISWGLVASAAPGPARNLVIGGLRLAGALGTCFAFAGSVVSDLSVGLARKASCPPARRDGLLQGVAILMLTSLWVGAGIVAAGLARAQVCRP
jgi:hypothetical protein